MPNYYIKISGAAWNVEGNTKQDAINTIQNHSHVYCTFIALEIGKDCDENGYPIKKEETK